ncbi:MAG: zinc ribbon domain-containing protein [Deltaproteobacteria bacterium]|nr:MAG: zinc ribbon domain-containing protein [Deltaproteobacteria bacterium]
MPIFEYNCEHCNYTFDKLLIDRDAEVNCPLCQGDVKKLMSSFAVGVSDKVTGKLPPTPGPGMCTTC